jgi:3-phosphoshikimate 1-carboxyvinyltransferase
MFRAFGAALQALPDGAIAVDGPCAGLTAPPQLRVPGDPSSAAFLLSAALLAGGQVAVRGVDVNPTRTGFLRVLERMGAKVELSAEPDCAGDPVATLTVRQASALRATAVSPAEIPSLIDEIPILAVLATQAEGATTIRGAGELRVKESDRIAQVAKSLSAMGGDVKELPDGLVIRGPSALRGARIDAMGDHRIAMSFAVAGLGAQGETVIEGAQWADISFPGFYELLSKLSGGAVSIA